ncbi:MAG: hypothetical protein ACAH59_08700 [Pseudobdellovibrionaceae bacterium]
MEKQVLVYQAYGLQDVIRQTMFSILSLLRKIDPTDTLQIWVYTDNKKVFSDFFGPHPKIQYVEITTEQIQKWRGKINFVHRVKVEILRDAGAKFNGSLYYCDGDTYFLSSPQPLFQKVNSTTSLMHIAENALDQGKDPLSKKILKFVKKQHFQIKNELVGIGPSTVMWNAGVLGIAEENKKLLPLVLELTDQAYTLYQKHVMEQLAFSFYLQTRTKILSADSVIYHYWNQKNEYQSAIDRFLEETKSVAKALESFDQFPFPGPPEPKKKKSLMQKLFLRKKK